MPFAAGRASIMTAFSRGDEQGASAVEYGLIVFAIAGLIALMVFAFGAAVVDSFTGSCDTIRSKAAPSNSCS
jgi:pilus assembly protein Flp/PilA